MRYNTLNKRKAIAQKIIDYLTDYGYDKFTAQYEVNNYVHWGLNALSPTVREDIRRALIQIGYDNGRK